MIEHLALAKDHLAKAKEFVEAAQVNHDHELCSAAAAELKASGPVGAGLAPTLRRLLGLKP